MHPSTSAATQYSHPPSLIGHGHMQSAGLLALQLLFLQRALQDRGCYSPSDRSLFNAVYQAAQYEELLCNKALAAKHGELVKMQKKLENMESVSKRSSDEGDPSPKSCDVHVFPRQKQITCNHTSTPMVQKPINVEQGKEINLIESMTDFLDAFANDTGGLCNKDNALITAVRLGDPVATQLVLDTGANISIAPKRANPYQRTALHWAAAQGSSSRCLLTGHKDVAEVLLAYGANLEAKTLGGATPLLLAVRDNANKDVIRMLLMNGADIDARDDQGRTALHVAAKTGDRDLVQLLMEYGADAEARYSKQHITPRQLASAYGHSRLADWLKQFESQVTDVKTQVLSTGQSPRYRQISLSETDTAFDGGPDKFHSQVPIPNRSTAFPENGKDPEMHVPL